MASYQLQTIPLKLVLEEIQKLAARGFDPLSYLSQLYISDDGARLRKGA